MVKEIFSHSRLSLLIGLNLMKVDKHKSILIPEYICNDLTCTLSEAGYHFIFYKLDNFLNPNWKYINSLDLNNITAIMMVHYFGFPQKIDDYQSFCKKNNLLLIEDNAHGFGGVFEQKPLGSFGDIGFSSPRKTLSLLSGSYLYLKEKFEKINDYPPKKRYKVTLKELIKNVVGSNYSFKSYLRFFLKRSPNFENFHRNEIHMHDLGLIDKFSQFKLKISDPDGLFLKRRKIYLIWLDFANENGIKPLFDSLPNGVVPLCFPVKVNDSQERNFWLDWGWKNQLITYQWPTLPRQVLNGSYNAVSLRQNIICFPIDINMSEKYLSLKLKNFVK